MNIKISICIFTYNREKMIGDAIKSALIQNNSEYEILLIDDGSTDNTENVVKKFKSNIIRYIRQTNKGRSAARNLAIKESLGEYIIWLGSDDALKSNIVNYYQSEIAIDKETDIFYSDIIITDHKFKPIDKLTYKEWNNNRELINQMANCNIIPDGGSLIKKNLYSIHGGYDLSFRQSQDYEWFCRVAHAAKFKYTKMKAYYWRTHNGDRASNNNGKYYDALIVERLVNKHSSHIFLSEKELSTLTIQEKNAIGATRYAMRLLSLEQKEKATDVLISAMKQVTSAAIKMELGNIARSIQ